MLIRLKGRPSLLLLAFVMTLSVAALAAGLSVMADAQEVASPTISSDKADYPPGGTVILTGSGWQPGESVNIFVNDDVGQSWSRNVDVTADESGQIRDEFQLPDRFVAQYSVKATGARSGVATTSFTDAAVTIEGKSICGPGSSGSCSPDYSKGPLTGWKERDKVPMRLKFDDTGTYTVSVRFDHATTSGTRIPGFEDLKDWTAGTGVNPNSLSVTLDQSTISGPIWAYTVTVQVTSASSNNPAFVNFNAIPDAGSHNYPGKSLQIRTSATRGTENAGNDVIGVETPGALPGNPDLLVTKTGPQSAAPGQEITYTLSYQNKTAATDAATGVRLTDVLPFNLNGPGENDPDRGFFVGCSGTPTCTITGTTSNTVIWELGNLAKGASGSRTLTVKVPQNASHSTQYSNLGQILSAENDATPGDNQSTWTTTISFNRAPIAVDDPSPTMSYSVDEDQTLTVPDGSTDVLANDSDPDGDPLNAVLGNGPSNGQVTLNQNGFFEYKPAANFHGSDSFTYKANDGSLDSNTATVSITVNAANDAPVANDDSYSVDEDQTLTILAADGVLKNDTDVESDQLSAVKVSNPTHGSVTSNANGSFTYTPDANFNGNDSFTYKVNDGSVDSNVATVSITVNPVNDAPDALNDLGSTGEAAAVSNSFISQYASSTAPTRLYRLNTDQRPYTFGQIGADIARPVNAIGYSSTDSRLYGYRLTGSLGIMKINPKTAAASFLGNPRGLPVSDRYLAGDVSPIDGSTYYLYANKSGVLWRVNLTTFRASSVQLSSPISLADFAVSPTDGNLYGVAPDGKLLRINPRTGQVTARSVVDLFPGNYGAAWFTAEGDLIAYENGISQAHGTLTWIANPTTEPSVVSQQEGPPTVGNDGAAFVAPPNPTGLSVVVEVLANDRDPDGTLDPNTLRIVQPPASGRARINATKTITYTSNSSYNGTDSFSYEVCDNGVPKQCDTATVKITSEPVTSSTSPAVSQNE